MQDLDSQRSRLQGVRNGGRFLDWPDLDFCASKLGTIDRGVATSTFDAPLAQPWAGRVAFLLAFLLATFKTKLCKTSRYMARCMHFGRLKPQKMAQTKRRPVGRLFQCFWLNSINARCLCGDARRTQTTSYAPCGGGQTGRRGRQLMPYAHGIRACCDACEPRVGMSVS